MKQLLILFSTTILLAFSFCACSNNIKKTTFELKKVSTVTVDIVDNITTKSFVNQYGDNTEPIWMIKYSINYPNERVLL